MVLSSVDDKTRNYATLVDDKTDNNAVSRTKLVIMLSSVNDKTDNNSIFSR